MDIMSVKQVSKQGHISLGKRFAGKTVKVEEFSDGSILLRPVEIVSTSEMELIKDKAYQERLAVFDRWRETNDARETDLDTLEKAIEA